MAVSGGRTAILGQKRRRVSFPEKRHPTSFFFPGTPLPFGASHSRMPVPVSALLLLAALATPQDTTGAGSISGIVSDVNGQHVRGVVLCAAAGKRCGTTDAGGAFKITDLRAGDYELDVRAPGLPAYPATTVTVRAGLDTSVEVTIPALEALAQEVTVRGARFIAPQEVKSSSFLVQPADVEKSAGALQDVSRVVQTLPGVAIGSDDFRNDIIVRGGSPLENLFIVDNIEIPNINSFATFSSAGGTTSLVDAALIQDVTFLSGGYPAPFSNRTSSVLQIAAREGDRARVRGRATLGFAGAGGIVEGPIGRQRGSWIVSLRRSFLDLFTNDVGIGGVPVTSTLNAKAVYDLTPADRLWIVNISGRDSLRLGATETRFAVDEEINNLDIRYRGWRAATGVNWQRTFGARGVGLFGITRSDATVGQSLKDLFRDGRPAGPTADAAIAAAPVVFREDSRESETTAKYDLTVNAPGLGKLQVGASVKILRARYDADQPFGADNLFSATPGLNAFRLKQTLTTSQTGAYVQSTRDWTRRVNVTWGARVDHYAYPGQTRLSPRAGVSVSLTDRWSWRTSYGRYFQLPPIFYLAVFPENRTTRPFRADHYVTGLSYIPTPTVRLTVEAYQKAYGDYPVAAGLPSVSLANIGDTFNIRDTFFPLVSQGRGRARGVEVFIEKKPAGRWFGQANLAVSQARHAGFDGVLRPGAFDYPVIANAVGGIRAGSGWDFSVRAAFLSGRPYTPFDAARSTAQSRPIYDLERINAERAPDYFRLDVRVDRRFTIGGRPLNLFAGVQNLTNRRNFAGYAWSRRSNTVRFQEQLGVFPILGFDWRF
ncbi:MAG: TonB-dependent receptor [Acidobacteria bacterium]|nr:MAG: TonB-dependent receptor [Acidobacteriota bacterium]